MVAARPDETASAGDIPVPAKRHVSYSAFTDWLNCGKFYQLKRVLELQERPAWWFVAGKAVHAATEMFDRQLYALTGR